LLGFQPADLNPAELQAVEVLDCLKRPLNACRKDAALAAREIVSTFAGRPLLAHFDVDVIDFVDSPVADVPSFHGAWNGRRRSPAWPRSARLLGLRGLS
jgi:hypothetical protein